VQVDSDPNRLPPLRASSIRLELPHHLKLGLTWPGGTDPPDNFRPALFFKFGSALCREGSVRVTAMEYGLIAMLIAVAGVAVGVVSNQFPTHAVPVPNVLVHHFELRG
jgi:hypothetical protein